LKGHAQQNKTGLPKQKRKEVNMPHIHPRVITALDAERYATRAESPPSKEDNYLAKLVKYIPGEAIATHQALAGFNSPDNAPLIGWLSLALLPISIFWFYFGTKQKGEPPAWSQVILCPIAFALWMIVVQSAAVQVLFDKQLLTPTQGSIVLIFATAVMPLLEKLIELIVKRIG
jgi:hypothetical protein